ncbi:hypothetical protein L228DRAFT_268188 [Xylona heveae TC161]|uniref:THO complex subunit 2 n=1 Tax=Xylona heveae (strain CBS 132557 / TC161) TaxID=1328760 RepID=A0A165GZT4_XYLHT|nr:hypothetical protein L228DRAFT_268188 [Xylona heveae TC161]KZF22808.1 hypothetical protein L228DRAFT_268188 [Xylona heveae TC161]
MGGPGGKRKRGERTYSQDSNDGSRPSPHRPGNLNLAQQNQAHQGHQQQYEHRGRGGRRYSRGGRGGGMQQRSPSNGAQSNFTSPRNTNALSPPAPPSQLRESVRRAQTPPAQPSTQPSTQPSAPSAPAPRPDAPAPASAPIQPVAPAPSPRPPQPPVEKKPPTPYNYEYLTAERVASWKEAGRKDIVGLGTKARTGEDPIILGGIFQELLKSGLDGKIEAIDAGSAIKDLLAGEASAAEDDAADGEEKFDPQSLFLDCLSILTENDVANPLLRTIVVATEVSPALMRQELETPLLQSLGMIRDTFGRMGIRKQTNLLYRQSNYNLLREESEGYSKLVTELFTTSSHEPPTSEVVEETFERVKALIGAFDLDVGRVLDITLDVFAAVLVKQYRFFVKFLRASSWWPKEKIFEGIQSSDQGVGTLPLWALPGSAGWTIDDEERENLSRLKEQRDHAFWDRVREVGMDAYFELGGRRVIGKSGLAHTNDIAHQASDADKDMEWIETTGTLPPQGNRVAAQLLGFKLRFYASPARDANDSLPVNLIYLAALLIKIGFISLRDLYPHLWPADEAMEAVREQKMKEKAERERANRPGGGAMNALAMAGALADDTISVPSRLREIDDNRGTPNRNESEAAKTPGKEAAQESTTEEAEKEKLPEPADQKVQLLKSLLCIGAIPESLFMLGRFPWLMDAFPDLPAHIHRILHHSLSKVYEPLRPLSDREGLRHSKKIPDPDQSGVPKGQVRLINAPVRKVLRWAQIDRDDTNEATDYRFYWDEWLDHVPACQNVDDVFSLCSTFLNYSGVKIGQDPALLMKLARIGKHSLNTDPSPENHARWIDLSKRLLVPALSLTKNNPGVVNEVFELLRNFPTSTRYSIYAEWYTGQISRLPDIKVAFDQARAETKDVLKRISKTNVKPMARALAKVAYASPGVVFSVAISQIESYDNLVEVVVECARYFTFLGYDVLTWSLMNSLGGKNRNRVQADGMLASKWLSALSLFSGRVFKRYSVMNPTPILQYVTDQVQKGNSTELIVLKEMTLAMAGIVADTNFNEAQTQAMAGGSLLQSLTLLQLLDKRHETKTTAKRLLRALTEPKLAGQLLISIAQERQTCIFKVPEPDAHLKLLGNLLDEIHRVLAQYLDFLRSNLSVKEFDGLVPDVISLIRDFGLDPAIAFWFSRPSIVQALADDSQSATPIVQASSKPSESPAVEADENVNEDGDVSMSDVKPEEGEQTEDADADREQGEEVRTPDVKEAEEVTTNGDLDMQDNLPSTDVPTPVPGAEANSTGEPWHPVLKDLAERIKAAMPEENWEILNANFYITFWQLTPQDMLVPTQSYDAEITRQQRKLTSIINDRSDMTVAGLQRKDKEKKHLDDLKDRLRGEMKTQVQSFSQTRSRLQREKDHWFPNFWGKWDALNEALIQNCFLPRLLLSPSDALYTFKMLKFLHFSGAANFRTMGVIDNIFREKQLTALMFMCTSREAENLGRFFNELFRDLSRWHADNAIYEKEAYGVKRDLPGYAKRLSNETKGPETFLDFEEFRRLLYKWHRSFNNALKACFTGGEYMHIRNAIIVLKAVHLYFPAVNWIGRDQLTCVTELSQNEKREDLKIAATSLLGNLKRREKQWMLPQAFNLVNAGLVRQQAGSGNPSSRAGSAAPGTPQPESKPGTPLDATAVEFRPKEQASSNGILAPQASTDRAEVEDGEIEDAKMKDASTAKAESKSGEGDNAQDREAQKPGSSTTPVSHMTENVTEKTEDVEPEASQPPAESEAPTSKSRQAHEQPGPSPAPSGPSLDPRPNLRRNASNSAIGRPQHALPVRPEGPPPRSHDRRTGEQFGERREGRDHRFAETGRADRQGDYLHDRRQGPPAVGRERYMGSDRDRRDLPRAEEREGFVRAQAEERPGRPHRDSRPRSREGDWHERMPSDRSFGQGLPPTSRASDFPARPARELTNMGPPPPGPPQHHEQGGYLAAQPHPDRAALVNGPQYPERGAAGGADGGRRESGRYERDSRRERNSHPQSPLRPEDNRLLGQQMREDGREYSSNYGPRYDENRPPTGPKGDRPPRGGMGDREVPPQSGPLPGAMDQTHGRLNQDYRPPARQQDPNYGRLNAGPEIPSGPRGRGQGRGGRNTSNVRQQEPPFPTGPQMPSPTISERQPPRGPSRGGPRTSSAQFEYPPSSGRASPPSTSHENAPDMSGVHPDRLQALRKSPDTPPYVKSAALPPQPAMAAPPVHPGPSPSGPAPSGPRNQYAAPVSPGGPGSGGRNPPTGPSSGGDRNRGDKRFAGIQNVLQQSGPERSDRGPPVRGRGGRSANAGGMSSFGGSSEPSTPGAGGRSEGRPDLFSDRVTMPSVATPPVDERPSSRAHRTRGGEGDRRSARTESSRPSSQDRAAGSRRDEERALRREDGRESRGSGRDDRERSRRSRGDDGPSRERRDGRGRDDAERRGGASTSGGTVGNTVGGSEEGQRSWGSETGRTRGSDRRDDRDRERRDGRKRGRGGDDSGTGERSFGDGKRPRRAQ